MANCDWCTSPWTTEMKRRIHNSSSIRNLIQFLAIFTHLSWRLHIPWKAWALKKATRRWCTSSLTITEGPGLNPRAYYYFYKSPVNINSRDRHLHTVLYGVVLCYETTYVYVPVYMSWNNGCIQFAFLEETEPAIYLPQRKLYSLRGEDFIFIIALYVPFLVWAGERIWISLKAGKRIGRNNYTENKNRAKRSEELNLEKS